MKYVVERSLEKYLPELQSLRDRGYRKAIVKLATELAAVPNNIAAIALSVASIACPDILLVRLISPRDRARCTEPPPVCVLPADA